MESYDLGVSIWQRRPRERIAMQAYSGLVPVKSHVRELLEMAKQQDAVQSEVTMSFQHMPIRLHYSRSFSVSVSSILGCTIQKSSPRACTWWIWSLIQQLLQHFAILQSVSPLRCGKLCIVWVLSNYRSLCTFSNSVRKWLHHFILLLCVTLHSLHECRTCYRKGKIKEKRKYLHNK